MDRLAPEVAQRVGPLLEGVSVTVSSSPGVLTVRTRDEVRTGERVDVHVRVPSAQLRFRSGTPEVNPAANAQQTGGAPLSGADRYKALATLVGIILPTSGAVDWAASGLEGSQADGAVAGITAFLILLILFAYGDLNKVADWVTNRMNRP